MPTLAAPRERVLPFLLQLQREGQALLELPVTNHEELAAFGAAKSAWAHLAHRGLMRAFVDDGTPSWPAYQFLHGSDGLFVQLDDLAELVSQVVYSRGVLGFQLGVLAVAIAEVERATT